MSSRIESDKLSMNCSCAAISRYTDFTLRATVMGFGIPNSFNTGLSNLNPDYLMTAIHVSLYNDLPLLTLHYTPHPTRPSPSSLAALIRIRYAKSVIRTYPCNQRKREYYVRNALSNP